MNELLIKGFLYVKTDKTKAKEAIGEFMKNYPGIDIDYEGIEYAILRDKNGEDIDRYDERRL